MFGRIVELAKALYRYAEAGVGCGQVTADARRLGTRTVFKRLGYLAEVSRVEGGE
jgi:hypothetical protein